METFRGALHPRQYGKEAHTAVAQYEALAVDLAAALDRPVAEAEALVDEAVEKLADAEHTVSEPWDCAACIRGRGKGPRNGNNRRGWPSYDDRLCPVHAGRIAMPRNRAERRRMDQQWDRVIRRQTRRLVREHKARLAEEALACS